MGWATNIGPCRFGPCLCRFSSPRRRCPPRRTPAQASPRRARTPLSSRSRSLRRSIRSAAMPGPSSVDSRSAVCSPNLIATCRRSRAKARARSCCNRAMPRVRSSSLRAMPRVRSCSMPCSNRAKPRARSCSTPSATCAARTSANHLPRRACDTVVMSVPPCSPSNSVKAGSADSAPPISASNAPAQACSTRRIGAFASPAKRVHSRRNRSSSPDSVRSACSRRVAAVGSSAGGLPWRSARRSRAMPAYPRTRPAMSRSTVD